LLTLILNILIVLSAILSAMHIIMAMNSANSNDVVQYFLDQIGSLGS
jgi:uncharacterized protein YggT (Ycf19 family)